MNAKECMIEADKLLQKWSCYSIENRRYIEKIFNGSNRYDMMLNVDVMQKQAKIYVLERGVTIYEYRTERKEILTEVLRGNKRSTLNLWGERHEKQNQIYGRTG